MASLSRSISEFFASAPPPSRNSESEEDGECNDPGTVLERRPWSHARQSGFNRAWTASFPWVVEVEGKGMLCRLCRKHNRRPQKAVVRKTTWIDVPCVMMTQHSLRRHDTYIPQSFGSKKLEAQLCFSRKDGGIV